MMNSMSRRVGRQVLKEQTPFLKQGAASEVTIALCRLVAVRAESHSTVAWTVCVG